MKEKSILFIDSGIGGITTLSECQKILKGENFIYYGDTLYAPYGSKDKGILKSRILDIITYYLKDIKAVVIACNTATTTCIKYLRTKLNIDIVGIEPAIKPAFKDNPKDKIILLSTLNTSRKIYTFNKGNLKYKERINIYVDNKLSSDIENNIFRKRYLKNRLAPLIKEIKEEGYKSIVLGCTHYIYIKRYILKALNKKIHIYDGNKGVAKRLFNILKNKDLNSVKKKGNIIFKSSYKESEFRKKGKKILKNMNKF